MTIQCTLKWSCVLLLGSSLILQGQPVNPVMDAAEEAVRRQEKTIIMKRKIVDAQKAAANGEIGTAAKLYEDAYKLAGEVGSGIDDERAQIVSGLSYVRLNIAQRAYERGDFSEADLQVSRVLRVDKNNLLAQDFKRLNDKALREQRGKVPTKEMVDRVPGILEEKTRANTLVHDGKILWELGKLDEADSKLEEALALDPDNKAALYYKELITESRFRRETLKGEASSKRALVEVTGARNTMKKNERLPIPNQYARTNLINTSPQRRNIQEKLKKIMIDKVEFPEVTLNDVVKTLTEHAKKRDPEQRGINFLVARDRPGTAVPSADITALAGAVQPTPTFPNALPGPAVDPNAGDVVINIPSLTDVRLIDVLDAITKVADRPIKYSIEDYAVLFSIKRDESPQMHTRHFRLDPNTFFQGLEGVSGIMVGVNPQSQQGGGGGGGGGGSMGAGGMQQQGTYTLPQVQLSTPQFGGMGGIGGGGGGGQQGLGATGISFVTRTNLNSTVNQMAMAYFTAAGVDFGVNVGGGGGGGGAGGGGGTTFTGTPTNGKALFFNDRTGIMTVRATLEDLDIIEQALQTLNMQPPMISIEAKFAEISQEDSKALGFDWFMGNTPLFGGNAVASGGTQPSLNGNGNPFPGTSPGTQIPSSPSDGRLTGGLRNELNAPDVFSMTGILSNPQFRVAIRALEQRKGVDVISAPRVTTISGRQASLQAVELQTIVTGVGANQTSSGGGGASAVGGTFQSGGVGAALQPTTQTLPTGPVLDVVPYVLADGYTVQMTIIPSVTEFLGYDDSTAFQTQVQAVGGNTVGPALTQQTPLPRIRVRLVTTTVSVWDGQTVVMGGLIAEDVRKTKDKVPVLGDIPFAGRLFRSESSATVKKNLYIFVTPTIIDPAGNRMHSDEEMPFAQTLPSDRESDVVVQ